jgi:multiple sugar transport system permease protein
MRMTTAPSKRLFRELGSWGFLSPHLALFLLFIIAPLFINSAMSLFNWSLLGKRTFIGVSNFIRIWTDDRFWQCVVNTSLFALVSVPLVIIVGILFATLLNQKIYGKLWVLIGLVSQTFFGSIGILTTWKWIFASYPSGLANFVCLKLGILTKPISWFETAFGAWACITFVTVWWIVGFSVLLYLGAIQRIPP